MKTIDSIGPLQDAPPSAVRIFRHYVRYESQTDGVGTANAVIAALQGYRHPNLYLQVWTGGHPNPGPVADAVQVCHDNGYKTIGVSWYTGDYTRQDWDAATAAGVDAYGPQCYWGNQGFTIWHAVRYRQFWVSGQNPVVIPECGRDAIEGGLGGWVKDGLTAEQYIAELLAYNAEIDKDSYVLGATVFTAGPTTS